MSGCIPRLSTLHSPVFLLNSCLDLFSAPSLARRDPLSRSYRVNLPSSLTVNHPSALVYSTRLRVSVCGTGTLSIKFSGFSRQSDYPCYWIVPKYAPYFQHPSALVYSTRLRVSVYGTVTSCVKFSGFSRQSDYPCYWIVPKYAPYFQVRLFRWICLRKSTSTLLNGLFRQSAMVSLLRPHVTR